MSRRVAFSAKAMGDLSARIIAHLGSDSPLEAIITLVVLAVQKSTMVDSVGIRLAEGPDFPYFFTRGFDQDFVEKETHLCARDQLGELVRDSDGKPVIECMCGNVIRGRTDSALPFFTEGGSFWTNCTTDLLASTPKEDMQSEMRNHCNSAGYESLALIPIRNGGKCLGLLQLNDRRKDMFSEEEIIFLEGVAASIGLLFSMSVMLEELTSQAAAATHCAEERGELIARLARKLRARNTRDLTSALDDGVGATIGRLIEEIEYLNRAESSCSCSETGSTKTTRPLVKRAWFFCPACRRAFRSDVPDESRPGQAIKEIGQLCLDENGDEQWECPLEDCDAAAVNCLHWSVLRQAYPELPRIPRKGKRYP